MFRVAKVDAEKQRSIAEVLGIHAFPSVFGMKDGIILDNFVGGLAQDEVCRCVVGSPSADAPGAAYQEFKERGRPCHQAPLERVVVY